MGKVLFRKNRINESNIGKWYIVTLISKDDLKRELSIHPNNNTVIATKILIFATDEESAIELAATQASYDNDFNHWSDEFILHSIKVSNRDDYEYGKKKPIYCDVYVSKSIKDQLDDDNDDSKYDRYGLEKIDSYDLSAYDDYDGDDYYGYNESFKSRSNARKHKMNETSLGLRIFKNEKEVYDHMSLELDLIIKRIERLYEWLPRHMLKTHAKDVAGILANIVEDTHFRLGDVQVYLDDLKRDPKDRHLCH